MNIRKLTENEHHLANLLSCIAFHSQIEDWDREWENRDLSEKDDWGAWHDGGALMARIIHYHFTSYLNGHRIANGGIGGVSTLPEYRRSGAIRAIFSQLLPHAYAQGEVISTLYPFNHAFYRKFGYETVCWQHSYEFSPGVLREYHFHGTAEKWTDGSPVDEWTRLYNRFAQGFNLAIHRDNAQMLRDHLHTTSPRTMAYLLRDGTEPVAYLIYRDVPNDPAAILSVKDLAWDGKRGLEALLGFLSRFSADYGTIRMSLPSSLQLFSIIHSPLAYDISQTVLQGYMIRVVNTVRVLECISLPDNACFVIRVNGDRQIPENNGNWEVSRRGVFRSTSDPDLTVSIQALGQLACGCVSLQEAMYRDDVTVSGQAEWLCHILTRSPVMVQDAF